MLVKMRQNQVAFTLVELLATIAIVAILIGLVIPWVANYVSTARQRADQQTLVVLNDALTRYKTQGGNLNALTSGAPISNVLTSLRSTITWNGLSHQVLDAAFTRPPRSIDSLGNGAQYRFTRFNTYTGEIGGSSPVPSANFVIIGSSSAIYSMDGITWADSTPLLGNNEAVYGGNKFVSMSYGTYVSYSSDGITWTDASIASGAWYVTYGNSKFVAVSYSTNQAAYSSDGITWTTTTLPSTANWQSVTYGGGKFVTVASATKAAYSSDGITWTAATLPISKTWKSVRYGGGKFVAVCTNSAQAAYSSDGITWSTATLPSTANWTGLTYGNGKFVIAANGSNKAAYSSDGITWTAATLPSSASWYMIFYGSSKFIVISNSDNQAATSSDGITWSSLSLPASVSDGCWGIAGR